MAPDHRVSYIIEENYAVLKIPKAILADSATYCLKLDDKVMDMGQVILWVEPLDRKRDKPSFTRRPAPDTVDGRRLSIRCAVDGYPNPEVTWFLHGEELGQDALFNVYTQDGYHHLGVSDPALLFDEPLVCRVENRAGCTQSVMILKRDGQEVYCEPVLEAVAADTAEQKPRPPTMEAEISETNSTNLHKVKVKESYTDQYNFVTLSAGTQVEVLAKNVPGAILARQADNHDKVCYVANKVIATKTAAASDVSKQESKENATDASQVNKPAETPETQELLSKEEQQDTTMPERRKLKSPSPQMTSTPKLRRREFGRESPEDISRRLGFQDSPSPKKEISYDELDIPDYDDGTTRPMFKKRLKNVEAKPGQRAQLECTVSGEPQPKVLWLKNNRPLKESDNCEVIVEDDRNILVFPNADDSDVGTYTARAMNVNGSAMTTAEFTLTEGRGLPAMPTSDSPMDMDFTTPTYFFQMSSCEVSEGRMARFDCRVVAYPKPDIVWMRDGKVIDPKERFKLLNFNNEIYSLLIQDVHLEDTGRYTCWARNKFGEAMTEAYLNVIAMQDQEPDGEIAPQFLTKFYDQQTTEGIATEFKAFIAGRPEPSVTWLLNDIELRDAPGQRLRHRDGTVCLEMKAPKVTQSGEYTCILKNKKGEAVCSAKLSVIEDKLQGRMLPKFFKKFDHIKAREGEEVKFTCVVVGEPKPNITWMLDHKPIDVSNRRFIQKQDGDVYTLTIKNLKFEDAGMITCKAVNSEGEVYSSANLHIRESKFLEEDAKTKATDETDSKFGYVPTFTKRLQDIKVKEGTKARFDCKVMGIPDPEVSWMKDGRVIAPDHRHRMTREGDHCELVIENVTSADAGVYTCIISNTQGKSSSTAELKLDEPKEDRYVPEKPREDKPAKKERERYSPEPYVKREPYVKKEPYTSPVRPKKTTSFTDKLDTEKFDDTKKYIDLPEMRAPPRLPTYKPVITDLGEETVRLAWRPAETYEAKRIPPVSYRLEAKELPGKDWMPLTSKLRDTTHYLSELSKDRDYMIRVRAENDFGISEPTDSLWLQRARAFPTVPISRPDIIDVEDTRAKLAWSRVDIPSFGPGDVPLTYMLEVQEPMKDWRTIARNLGDTEYVVDGLRPGTDYKFRVRAKTPTGALSDPSPAASLYTTLAKARAPVDRLEVLAYEPDTRSVQLSWQRVHIPPYNYEDQPLMYMVEYNEPPMPDWQPLVSGIPTTRYRVTHLDPMRDYKFRVRALTSYGVSPPSPALPVTLRQAPGSSGYQLPASVTLSDVQPTSARLSWQRPMYDLSRTVHYDVEMLEPPLTVWQRLASGLTDTSFRATGLKPTRDYQFRVIPRVDQRQLEPTVPVSLTSAPVKPRLPIDQPRLSLISPDSCQLSWQPAELPVYHRSKVPIYYKVEMQELPSSAWMPVARRIRDNCYHVTGLRPNKDYKFRISAETDYGMSEPSLPASLYRKPAPKFATNEPLIKDISQNVVQLSWEPADAPSAVGVVSYRVEVQTPPGISTWTTLYANHASPSVRLADLRPDLDYLVRIRAICGDYVSDPTLPIYIPRRATPPRMSNEEPYAVDIGNDFVKLQWRSAYIPSQIMDYAPISYRLEAQELPGGLWTPVAHGIAHTDFKVTGLSPLKDYNFRIRAENDYGVSDPTPAVMIKRRSVEPTLPRDEPMLYDVGPNSIRLSWRPASLPSQLQSLSPLHYTIYVQEPPNKSWRPLVRRVPGTSYHITGLLPDRDYFFRVQAENEHGQSRPTDAAYLPRHSDIKRPISIPEVSDFADDLTSVRLRWKPRAGSPFDAAPNRYLIESWEPVRREWRPVAKGIRDTTYHLRDLPRVPDHLFRVRYETEKAGLSEPSLPISVSRFYSLPKMPVHRPQLDEVDMDSVRLSWMTTYIPDAATRNKVRFYIEQREIPDGTWRTVASDVYDNYYRVRGLKERSDYEFRVKVNVDGVTSEPSYPVSLFRRPVIPKVKFETPEVVEVDDSTISLKWNKIDVPAFGYDEEPLSFMIERQSLPGYEWTPIATNITGFRHTIRDLKPFQDYKFRVRGIYTSGYTEPSPPVPVYRRPSESKLGYIGVTELEGSQKYSKYQTTPLPTESLHSSTPDVKPKKRVTRRYSSSYEMYDSKDTNIEASFQPSPTPPPAPKFRRENAYVYRRNISPVKEPELFRFQTPEPVIHKELDSNKDLYHWYNKRRASDAGLDLEELRRSRRDSEYDFRMEERRHALLLETENRSRRRPSPVTTPRKTPVVASSSEVGESYASVADRYEDIKCPHIIRPGHWNYPRRRMSVSLDYQDLEKLRQRTYELEKKYSKSSRSESGNTIYVVEDSADLQHYKKVGHVSRADLVELYPRRGSFSNERDSGYFVISKFSLSVSGLSRTRSHTPPGRYVRPASVEPSPSLVYTRAKSVQPRTRSLTPDYKKYTAATTQSSYTSTKSEKRSSSTEYMRPRSYSISGPSYDSKVKDSRPVSAKDKPKFNRLVENSKSLIANYSTLDKKCEERLEQSYVGYRSRQGSVSQKRSSSIADLKADSRYTSTPRGSVSQSPARIAELKAAAKRRASVSVMTTTRASSVSASRAGSMARIDPSAVASQRRSTISSGVNDDLKIKLDSLTNKLEAQKKKKKPKPVMKVKSFRGEGYVMDDGSWQPKSERLSSMYSKLS